VHKGDAQRALKDYNGSIQSYNAALKIASNKTAAWSGIAEDYTALKEYANASAAAARTTELDNKTKTNWLREGNLLQAQGMYQESVAKYDGALALDPQYKDALYKKATSLMATGNNTGASHLFAQMLQIDPKFKQAYNAEGIALEANGKYIEALQAYENALVIDPAYSQALVNKMHMLLVLKKQNEAMQIFMKI
jgi:tetratricopeptide (TPR) repeat protein